jgi:hypothetical protein
MPVTKEPCHKTEIIVQVDSVTGSGGDVVEVQLTETQSGESFVKQTLNTVGGPYMLLISVSRKVIMSLKSLIAVVMALTSVP